MSRVTCPYCDKSAFLVNGATVYPHRPDLRGLRFYMCRRCDAWVGCHRGTVRPLGHLANADLRRARMDAHAAFDPLWKGGKGKRERRYAWLARWLGINVHSCHIAQFDMATCHLVIDICLIEAQRIAMQREMQREAA